MSDRKYNLLRKLSLLDYTEQIFLPKDEYARVMSEFNSRMSDEDRKHRIVTKAIGDYWYTIVNLDFDEYIVIRKTPIEDLEKLQREWKDIDSYE